MIHQPAQPKPIRVAVTYRVCQHWRVPMFERLTKHEELDVTVLHGSSVAKTKLVNGHDLSRIKHIQHWTIKWPGCEWVWHPFLFWSLLRLRPDVILAEGGSNTPSNVGVFAYSMLFRRPVVWWTLGELRGSVYRGPMKRLFRWSVDIQEWLSSVYLGYSTVAIDYFRRMGRPLERCFRAVNCVDTDKVFLDIAARGAQVAALRRDLGYTDNQFVVLFVGALTAGKKIERLLEAFAELNHKSDNVRLLIVGDGTHRSTLEEYAQRLGIAAHTRFTGNVVEHVSDYFELGDVLVLPGLGGLVISEALAHSLPVICNRADGCEVDLVRDGKTGFRIESDDDEEIVPFIVSKLSLLMENQQLCSQMQTNARNIIETEFNVNTYLDNVVDAIRFAATQQRVSPIPSVGPLEDAVLRVKSSGHTTTS